MQYENTVEVFRTNLETPAAAQTLAIAIGAHFPTYYITFDLEDCDRILRIKATDGPVDLEQLLKIFQPFSFDIQRLD